MANCIGIYSIVGWPSYSDVIADAISELYQYCSRTIICCSPYGEAYALIQERFPDAVILGKHPSDIGHFDILETALASQSGDELAQFDQLIFAGSQLLGPFGGLKEYLSRNEVKNSSIFAPIAYLPHNEHRKEEHAQILDRLPAQVASSEFMVINSDVLSTPGFFAKLLKNDDLELKNPFVPSLDLRIHDFAVKNDIEITLASNYGSFETTTPVFYESDALVRAGVPFLSTSLIHTPYTMQDSNALNLRRTLETIRSIAPDFYAACWSHILATGKLRNIHAIADEVEIFDENARNPNKENWSFGPVAVLIHAFYSEMMDDFYRLIKRIDVPKKVFITTATPKNRQDIEVFLSNRGFDADEFEVRVVKQNRGRDMSSLFISFRDVILSGEYDVCLRLHSKRTPQVRRQVGESFKDHLFDNLVHSSGYVRNVLDYMEENQNVGLMMPPIIHIGFGTLGHSWFNNRKGVEQLAKLLDLKVQFDDDTPLAPYGTMYWFRAEALKKMFEYEWQWESFNEEPRHVDGGVAHLQERLIGYVAQDAGYRVLSIANRKDAARNYAKLEFKLQMLAAAIPHGDIVNQEKYISGFFGRTKTALLGFLLRFYQHQIMVRPGVYRIARPMARYVRQIFD